MTEQYRIIADRDNGDDPVYADVNVSTDRVTVAHFGQATEHIVRIERPVPTTCICGPQSVISDGPNTGCPVHGERPHPPTREQILDAITCGNPSGPLDYEEEHADRVVELLKAHYGSAPMHEQIAEVLYSFSGDWRLYRIPWSKQSHEGVRKAILDRADAVLTLIQNGADR